MLLKWSEWPSIDGFLLFQFSLFFTWLTVEWTIFHNCEVSCSRWYYSEVVNLIFQECRLTCHLEPGFPLKSQDKNSELLQDFLGPEIPKNQHLFLYRLGPRPVNLTAKQDTAKLKMQCQCNTSLSIATTVATALLNIKMQMILQQTQMRPDLRYWRYINHLLTYLPTYKLYTWNWTFNSRSCFAGA